MTENLKAKGARVHAELMERREAEKAEMARVVPFEAPANGKLEYPGLRYADESRTALCFDDGDMVCFVPADPKNPHFADITERGLEIGDPVPMAVSAPVADDYDRVAALEAKIAELSKLIGV